MWFAAQPFEPTMIERLDAMFASRRLPGRDRRVRRRLDVATAARSSSTRPPPAATWTTCATRSCAFVDERYPTAADRDHRGLAGKSSGGYGAMVVPMLRPDVFGALASHAGDALFEACYLPEFPKRRAHAARRVRRLDATSSSSARAPPTTSTWSASARSRSTATPPPTRPTRRSRARRCCPFDVATGRLIDDVWAQWLDKDPVRMAPAHADALRSMRRIYLDAGRGDEYFLDLGAQAFGAELDKLGVEHTLELFDGTHGGSTYRYPGAIRELVLALT